MSIDGSWDCVVASPMGKQKSVLTFVTDGATLTGTNAATMSTDAIVEGRVEGNALFFKTNMTVPMPMTLIWTLAIDGDALSGGVEAGPFGRSPVTGTRVAA